MSSLSTNSLRRLRAPLGLPDCLKVMDVEYSGSLEARPFSDVSAEGIDRRYLKDKIYRCNICDRERLYEKSLQKYPIYRR